MSKVRDVPSCRTPRLPTPRCCCSHCFVVPIWFWNSARCRFAWGSFTRRWIASTSWSTGAGSSTGCSSRAQASVWTMLWRSGRWALLNTWYYCCCIVLCNRNDSYYYQYSSIVFCFCFCCFLTLFSTMPSRILSQKNWVGTGVLVNHFLKPV